MSPDQAQAWALLTPTMRGLLERMHRARRPPLYTLTPAEARAAYAKGADVLEVPAPVLARVEEFRAPARDGHATALRLYANEGGALPVLVYFHGGGFMVGGIDTHDTLCRVLAQLAGCAVVSVDYRLSPEHHFPCAVHDAWDALAWVHAQAAALGLDAQRIAVAGDSAGGTLATVCAMLARDAGIDLTLQVLLYPGTAAWHTTASHQRFAQGFVLDQALADHFLSHYAPTPEERMDWRFAPMEADTLAGVAPVWLGLAECDPMVDDGLANADRLRFEAVPVQLELYRGVVHEFIKMGRALPEARQAHRDIAQALREAFRIPASSSSE